MWVYCGYTVGELWVNLEFETKKTIKSREIALVVSLETSATKSKRTYYSFEIELIINDLMDE